VLHVYLDSKGLPTAGVGHLLDAEEKAEFKLGAKISQAQSDAWLAADLKDSEDAVNSSVHTTLTQNEFDALVSLTFNIGVHGFEHSTVVKKLNAGDKKGAAEAILLWNKPPEIQGRRRTEYLQFLNPYKVSAPSATKTTPTDDMIRQPSPSEAPTNSEQGAVNVKAEITPEGGVKVESTQATNAPKERVAVVKAQPEKWYQAAWTKIVTFITGNAVFQWIWGQLDTFQSLHIPVAVWYIVSGGAVAGGLLWIGSDILETRRANERQKEIDQLLVTQNSTPDNLVQLIPADEVELYRARGFRIITRGDADSPQPK